MLLEFLRKEVLPFLRKAKISGHRLAKVQNSNNRFRLVKANLPQALHKDLDRVQQAVDDRRFMELQTNCQLWLHSWLLIHAPISFLLIIFTAWHAIVAVRLFIIQ
jgi:nitrogen fixation/metabolism regulation signal transduction histidine kinase